MSYYNVSLDIERLQRSQMRDPYHTAHSRLEVLDADQAFSRLIKKGVLYRLWGRIRQKPYKLWDLKTMTSHLSVRPGSSLGVQLVPVKAIQGSEDKENAFDRNFHPLHDRHSRERWISIALARKRGQGLPPVELIKIDDGRSPVYFVRDGHHRISVARAFGQHEIEANVTVWHLSGPSPWNKCQKCQPALPTAVALPQCA